MTRRLWIPLVLSGLAASLGGCNCNPPAKEMSVEITSPKNGATVTMKEDADNTKSGLQFEVKLATTNVATDGTGFAKVLVDGKASNSATIGSDGTAVVTVDASTLASPDGAHVLQALAGDEDGTAESAKVSVTLDSTELTECVVTISDPVSGTKLNGKSDLMPEKAGIQSTVSVHTAGCGSTGKIRVCMQGEGLTGTPCKGNVGIAVGEANLSSTNSTTLTVDWPEGAVVVIGEHDNNTRVTDSQAVLVTVDSTSPTCTFVSPVDQAVLSTLNTDVQIKTTGAEFGQTVSLTSSLKPEAQTGTVSDTGDTTIAATLPLGQQTLTATVTDQSGNEGVCAITVTVDIEGCDVVLTDPPTGEYLFNIANANPGGTPLMGKYTIVGKSERCKGGLAKFTKTIGGVESDVGTADVDATTGAFSRLLLFPDGEKDATLTVKIDKAGVAPNSGAFFTYSTDFTAPTCTFVSPVDGAQLTSQNVDVVLKVTDAEVDQDVVLSTSGKPETMTGKMTASGDVTIAASLPVGAQTLTVAVSDKAKNPGTCSIAVSVDVDGCDVSLSSPATGSIVLNIANANPTGTPPVGKYLVAGSTTRCASGLATFTRTIGGVETDVGTAAVDSTGRFSLMVDFPDGATNETLTVKITKTGYAANAGAFFTYSTDFVAPTCTFVSPTNGATVTTQNPNVQVTVTDAEVDQDVILTSSAKPETMTGKMTASGDVTIAASLPVGAQTLGVSVTDVAGNKGVCQIDVTVDILGCDIVLTDPTSPELIVNIANGAPTGTPLVGKYTIQGSTTRCAGGTVTFVKTIGGVAGTPGTATVAANGTFGFEVSFGDAEFNSSINIKVDKAGMATNAGVDVAYFSDFTPPTLDLAVPALGNLYVVNASNPHLIAGDPGYVLDESASTAGGQVSANLNVTGIGTVATSGYGSALGGSAMVRAGAATQFSATATSNAQQSVSGNLNLAEGYVGAVVITLVDSAGNTVTRQWDARVATEALPAALTITNPAAGTINVFKDLGGDRATYAQVQGVVTFGVTAPQGSELVMCSSLQLGSAPSGCQAGYFELPGTRVTATGTSQFYGGLKLPQGTQDIIAQMTDAVGGVVTSAPKALVVDTVPPVVTSVAATDDTNTNGTISGSELAPNSSATFVANVTGAEGRQASFTTTDSTGKVSTVFANVVSGVATFVVAGIPDGVFTGKVAVTDVNGNPNASTSVSPPILNDTAALSITFQRVAPSISVVAPNFTVCNQARQKQPPTGPSICDLDFTVSVGSSATSVEFSLTPSNAGTFDSSPVTTFTNGRATKTFALDQSTSNVVLGARVYDAAGNYRDASWTLSLIDTVAPSLTIVSPPNGSTQFTQRFPFSVTTDAEVGQTVTVTSSANAQVVGTGLVVAGTPNTATFDVNVPGSNQTLSASVVDLAGNTSPIQSVDIQMNLAGCDVNFINPASANPIFNLANAPGGLVHITGNTTRLGCESTTIEFTAAINGAAAIPVGSTTASSGNFSFDYTFPDGSVVVFEGKSTVFGSTPNGFTAITDITPPTLVINAPVPNASSQLFLVAKTGNLNVKAGTAGYVPELDDTTVDGQVLFGLSVTGAGSSAGAGTGKIEILQGATSVYSDVSADNAARALTPTVTLEQAFVGTLLVTATDHAGNSASASWGLTVDVLPPIAPIIQLTDPGSGVYTRAIAPRGTDIDFVVLSPTDDGPSPQTLAWDVGFSTSTLLGATAFDLTSFDNASLTKKLAAGIPGTAGSASVAPIRGAPPFNTYFLGAAAIDGMGNRSALSSTTLKPWGQIDIQYPGTSSTPNAGFGQAISAGADIDGDAKPDFAVAAPYANNNTGGVFLFKGGTTPPSLADPSPNTGALGYFGFYVVLGHFTQAAHADLIAYDFSVSTATRDYAFVPAINTSGSWWLSKTPLFRFHSTTGGLRAAAAVPDVNDDGLAEIAISESTAASNLGKIYIFYGRPDWTGLVSAGIVDVSKADVIVTGTDIGGRLGTVGAFAGVRDPTSSSKGALLAATTSRVYLFTGSKLSTPGSLTASDGLGPFYLTAGLAPSAAAVADANGDGLLDVIVGDANRNSIFAFPQNSPNSFVFDPGMTAFASSSGLFGYRVLAGAINTDAFSDLVVGGNPATAGKFTLFSTTPAGSLTPLSTPAGTVVSGPNTFGNNLSLLDTNADSALDIISASPSGGINGNGQISIFY